MDPHDHRVETIPHPYTKHDEVRRGVRCGIVDSDADVCRRNAF